MYKQESPEIAFKQGLEFVVPRVPELMDTVKRESESLTNMDGAELLFYCARGGMRSSSLAFLFSSGELFPKFTELPLSVVEGGYKSYRQEVLGFFKNTQQPCNQEPGETTEVLSLNDYHVSLIRGKIIVLGGYTGSGKTEILTALKASGENVIDLEGLAHHKGSSFGGIGQASQPSREHYENILYEALQNVIPEADPRRLLWFEDESQLIGQCKIPDAMFQEMRRAPLLRLISANTDRRLKRILSEYGNLEARDLEAAILRVSKRLGGETTKKCLGLLKERRIAEVAEILLEYYDKGYERGLQKRKGEGERGGYTNVIRNFEIDEDISEDLLNTLISTAVNMMNE